MFCVKCGKEIMPGAKFCTGCGAPAPAAEQPAPQPIPPVQQAPVEQPVPPVQPQPTPAPQPQPVPQQVDVKAAKKAAKEAKKAEKRAAKAAKKAAKANNEGGSKKPPVFVWIIIAVLVVAAAVAAVFVLHRSKTINVNDYMTVEFTGYDSMGKATVTIDESFWEDLYNKSRFEDKSKVKKSFTSHYGPADYMEEAVGKKISYDVDPEKKLSNGDEVTVSWKIKADSIEKKYGVKVEYEDTSYTVEKLDELKEFDPFDGIEISYTGIEGDGKASIKVVKEDAVYNDFSYSSSQSYYLSEGDIITVTYAPSYSEDELAEMCAEKYGMVPTTVTKDYKVEGLGHLLKDSTEITEESMGSVIEDCEKKITDVSRLSSMEEMQSIKYLGSYLLQEADYSEGNEVIAVFECSVMLSDSDSLDTDSFTFYTYVEINNVSINEKGECGYEKILGTTTTTVQYETKFDKKFNYYGYEKEADCKAEIEEAIDWYVKYYGLVTSNTFGEAL